MLSTGMGMMTASMANMQNLVAVLLQRMTAPPADPIAGLIAGYKAIADLAKSNGAPAAADGEVSDLAALGPALVPIAQAIAQRITQPAAAPALSPALPAAPRSPPTPVPALPRADAAGAPARPAAVVDDPAALAWQAAAVLLVRGASENGTPAAYAECLVGLLGEDQAGALLDAHPGPALPALIVSEFPALAPYRAWVDDVCAQIRESFSEPAEPAAGVTAGSADLQPAGPAR